MLTLQCTQSYIAQVPASTGAAPSRTLRLQEAVQWRPGDKIVLTSTFWKDENVNQNEVRCCCVLFQPFAF